MRVSGALIASNWSFYVKESKRNILRRNNTVTHLEGPSEPKVDGWIEKVHWIVNGKEQDQRSQLQNRGSEKCKLGQNCSYCFTWKAPVHMNHPNMVVFWPYEIHINSHVCNVCNQPSCMQLGLGGTCNSHHIEFQTSLA